MPTAAIQNGRPAADCPPAPVRVTKSLLGYGVIAGPFYVAASLAEALTRSGFSLARDDWSLLANGTLGWIHMLVLVLTGLMVGAAAAGVVRQLRAERRNAASGWFLGVYAAGLVGAGFFVADPADGFPVGTPPGPTVTPSWHGTLHIVFGGIGFLGLITACLVLAWQFRGLHQLSWAIFSLATGVLFFAAFAAIATGGAASSAGVLAFTGAVILAWTWLALVSVHLYRRAAAPGRPEQASAGWRAGRGALGPWHPADEVGCDQRAVGRIPGQHGVGLGQSDQGGHGCGTRGGHMVLVVLGHDLNLEPAVIAVRAGHPVGVDDLHSACLFTGAWHGT